MFWCWKLFRCGNFVGNCQSWHKIGRQYFLYLHNLLNCKILFCLNFRNKQIFTTFCLRKDENHIVLIIVIFCEYLCKYVSLQIICTHFLHTEPLTIENNRFIYFCRNLKKHFRLYFDSQNTICVAGGRRRQLSWQMYIWSAQLRGRDWLEPRHNLRICTT
jgi:hypothetical protein